MGTSLNGGMSLVPIGGTKNSSGRSPKDRMWLGERALRMRNEGLTMPMIAKELSTDTHPVSVPSVYRWIDLALSVRIPPSVDAYRKQQNDRYDQTQRDIQHQIDAANYVVQQAMLANPPAFLLLMEALKERDRAIGLQLRLDDRRARLNGLDAPIRVEATVEHVDPREAELAEMVREAKARMANKPSEEADTDA